MCGINGIMNLSGKAAQREVLDRMVAAQHHRGPDGCATFLHENVGLGHNRLKIIDLTDNARQPMTNEDGTVWLVFNGEIYNFRELRRELLAKGHRFRSETDSEVLVHLYEDVGPDLVGRLNGIFAFALLDINRGSLLLARDPFGVKPLFVSHGDEMFLFASEIKAILAAGAPRSVDPAAVAETLVFAHASGRRTLFRDINRLLPGETLLLQTGSGESSQKRFWKPRLTGNGCPGDSADRIRDLMSAAVDRQMFSDVPVGSMCSGGIDSSLVSAIAAGLMQGRLDTYVVKVEHPQFDESRFARIVSDHIVSQHHVLSSRPGDADDLLPLAIWLHDEPLLHENSIPILQISLLAKNQVTVLLSGEGADEVFGGYANQSTFRTIRRLWNWVPGPLVRGLEPLAWNLRWTRPARLLQRVGAQNLAESMTWSASRASPILLRHFGLDLQNGMSYRQEVAEEALEATSDPVLAHILYDQQIYLQTLLDRQDRMTMGASIECRVPFLDLPLVEAANSMGMGIRHREGKNKWALREMGRHYLPREIFDRPKHPFGLPLGGLLRKSNLLRGIIQGLENGHLVRNGVLPRIVVARILQSWNRGGDTLARLIWTLANLEIWWEVCIEGRSPERAVLPSHTNRDSSREPYRVVA